MAYDSNAGCIASGIFASEETIPIKMNSKEEILGLVKKTFRLKPNDKVLIKPVAVEERGLNTRNSWSWAIKIDKMIKTETEKLGEIESNLFLINPKIYLPKITGAVKKTKKEKIENSFYVLNVDVFSENQDEKKT